MRHKARRISLEAIYRFDNTGEDPLQALEDIVKREVVAKETVEYARKIVTGIKDNAQKIDKLIAGHIENWEIERLSIVDRAILRIGIYEISEKLVPFQVAIDEAIRLAKEYGGEDSYKFINGVLDAVRKQLCPSR